MAKGNLKIRLLIVFMVMTLLGLVTIQAVWFSKAFDMREAQLSEKVNLALRSVADQILRANGDFNSRIEPIQREAENSWFVRVGSNFPISSLDSLLKREFKSRQIDLEYQYAMVESSTGEIILGNTVLPNYSGTTACKGRLEADIPYDFRVTFSGENSYVLQSMGVWIFSSIAMIAVLVIFSLLLYFLLKEKRLSAIKANFVNNLTHELKTPITNISIASEVLLNPSIDQSPARKQVYASIIHQETQRLKTLVDRVLQISALENDKLHLEKGHLNLNEIISEAAEVAQGRIEARGGLLEMDLSPETLSVQGDRHHLLNTLYNLIDNADKYSPDPPQIKIRSTADPEGYSVSVEDHGRGIPRDRLNLIFGKFYRVDQEDIQDQRGFGLGLSYVQMIVKAHGGKVTVESEPGKGSIFSLLFPLQPQQA